MPYKELAVQAIRIRNKIDKLKGKYNYLLDAERGERYALSFLYRATEEIHPKMLAKDMNISTARVAKLLSQLEEKGFIRREVSQVDKRQVTVILLPEGQAHFLKSREAYYQMYEDVLAALGEHDAKEYIRIQNRLFDILSEQKGQV